MTKSIPSPSVPRQKRAIETYERLLSATGELLDEVGVERISTNLIAERAGVSPPAFYRYFQDKYDVLAALGRRLMEAQNELLVEVGQRLETDPEFVLSADLLAEIQLAMVNVTENFTGGVWIMNSLRAIPKLGQIRSEAQQALIDTMVRAAIVSNPGASRDEVYRQTRLSIEIGHSAIELVLLDPDLDRQAVLRDAAAAIAAFNDAVQP